MKGNIFLNSCFLKDLNRSYCFFRWQIRTFEYTPDVSGKNGKDIKICFSFNNFKPNQMYISKKKHTQSINENLPNKLLNYDKFHSPDNSNEFNGSLLFPFHCTLLVPPGDLEYYFLVNGERVYAMDQKIVQHTLNTKGIDRKSSNIMVNTVYVEPFEGANIDPQSLEVTGIDLDHPLRNAKSENQALGQNSFRV